MHRLTRRDWLAAGGVFAAIGMTAAISSSLKDHFLLAPFGATSVIALLTPQSEFAPPRNILGGYAVTSVVGVLVANLWGCSWWSYAFSVTAALLLKRVLGVVHPPSAAMPIILLNVDSDDLWRFVFHTILPGLAILVAVAVLYNRYFLGNGYPLWKPDHAAGRARRAAAGKNA